MPRASDWILEVQSSLAVLAAGVASLDIQQITGTDLAIVVSLTERVSEISNKLNTVRSLMMSAKKDFEIPDPTDNPRAGAKTHTAQPPADGG